MDSETTSLAMENLQLENADNVQANDTTYTPFQLSELEKQILDLYDRLEELQLEIALMNAEDQTRTEQSDVVTEKDIEAEQQALLEAKARYNLKNNIVESVLIANPILKAVHAGSKGSPIERDILPLVQQRDKLSVSLTDGSAKILAAKDALTDVEVEHISAARNNKELATKMIALANQAGNQKTEDVKDAKLRNQLEELESSVNISRSRWRIMKGTASAVVAGSGMDWARDPVLRELVLDNDAEE